MKVTQNNICDKKKCTGCFACYNACKFDAIEMKEDEFGYVYPYIDKSKCVNCKICLSVCPSINYVKKEKPLSCYAMCAKDQNILKNSTSGGAATIFSQYVLEKNGVVYGACFQKNRTVEHVRIEDVSFLEKLKGSKYVHSYVKNTFSLVKKDLESKRMVLYIGTPCQIAGLKMYLRKEYDYLFCVDLICHGVPSQKYFKDMLHDEVEKIEIDKVTFRDDSGFSLKIIKDEKILIQKSADNSRYYEGFLNGLFYRENCYNCNYSTINRVSDITIGDFWGLGADSCLKKFQEKGISVLLPITEKGMYLINECKNNMIIDEREINEAVNGNSQLRKPSDKPTKYNKFQKIYIKKGFKIAYDKTNKLKTLKKYVKKFLNKH